MGLLEGLLITNLIDSLLSIELVEAILAIDWLRMLIPALIGIGISYLPWKWAKPLPVPISILIYHGLSLAIRWYHCPLDPPLFCEYSCEGEWYQPARLAEVLSLDKEYLGLWITVAVIFAVLVIVIGGALVFYLRKVYLKVKELRFPVAGEIGGDPVNIYILNASDIPPIDTEESPDVDKDKGP